MKNRRFMELITSLCYLGCQRKVAQAMMTKCILTKRHKYAVIKDFADNK